MIDKKTDALLKELFPEFSAGRTEAGRIEINVSSIRDLSQVGYDLEERIEDSDLSKLSINLPLDTMLCELGELEDMQGLRPVMKQVKRLALETDQLVDFQSIELMPDVEEVVFGMRLPRDGLNGFLDAEEFQGSILSFFDPKVTFSFVLFDSNSKGPRTRSLKLPPQVAADVVTVNDAFLGFQGFKGCTYQKRFTRV